MVRHDDVARADERVEEDLRLEVLVVDPALEVLDELEVVEGMLRRRVVTRKPERDSAAS
jgi:hypothetical protein